MSGREDSLPLVNKDPWSKALSIRIWQRRHWPLTRYVATSTLDETWEEGKTYHFNLFLFGIIPLWKWNVRASLDRDAKVIVLEGCGGPIRSLRTVKGPF